MSRSNRLSRRRFLEATGGVAAAATLAGCTEDEDPENTDDEPTDGTDTDTETQTEEVPDDPGVGDNTLSLINSSMDTLDPISAADTASGRVIQNVHDALINYPNGTIAVETLLTEDYEVSNDSTQYTFNLKQGMEFHDGSEVTAQDIVYSFERLAQSDNSRRKYFILDFIGVTHETETVEVENDEGEMEEQEVYVADTLGVEAEDDYTFTMNVEAPFHSTLEVLAYTSFSVIPEGIVGDIEGYDGEMDYETFASENPIGCGPFKFDDWSANTSADVVAFENYHGSAPEIDGVHWQVIEDDNARFTYAMNQNADAFGIPDGQYDPNKVTVEQTDDLGRDVGTYGPFERNNETANYLGVATISVYYIGFNMQAVEKPVRQAVAHAMDQSMMVEEVFKGRGNPAYHFTPPNIYPGSATEYESHAEESYPYGYNEGQLQEARKVMEEAGYGDDNRYEFTFTTYESSSWQDMGEILRDQLSSVYIDMTLEEAPFNTLLERGRNGNLEAYSLGWIMDWPTPDNFLQLMNPPQTDTSLSDPTSYINWKGTDGAQRAEDAWKKVQDNLGATDSEQQARNEAYVEMEEANWEDVGFLNVYHNLEELFWYDTVDLPHFGGAGFSRMKHNNTTLNR